MIANDGAVKSPQTVSLADEEAVKQILVSTVFGLWDMVNNLTRLRPSKPERYRVTIFGSSRAQPGTFAYDEVKRVAGVLAEMGCDIVTGGGPGLMQAANEGAVAVNAPERDRSIGIRAANDSCRPDADIASRASRGRILVIATREDLTMLREVIAVIANNDKQRDGARHPAEMDT